MKTLWEKEKMLVTSIFSFSHNVLNRIESKTVILTDVDFEKIRKRRRMMKERSVSPVDMEDNPMRLTPLKTFYQADDLCNEPDYKLKCTFLSHMFQLQPVSAETRKGNED